MSESAKSRRAVVVSVQKDGEDLRISLDDAVCEDFSVKAWMQKEHVTSKPVAGNAFEKMEFDEKELADFGYYVLSRLSAFVKRNEN